jgi:hypothetical protein
VTGRARSTITALIATLLVVGLSGCAERVNQGVPAARSTAAQQEGSEPSHSDPSPAPTGSTGSTGKDSPKLDRQSADRITGAVGSAQAALDDLNQDFAGDDAATGN